MNLLELKHETEVIKGELAFYKAHKNGDIFVFAEMQVNRLTKEYKLTPGQAMIIVLSVILEYTSLN